MIDALHRWFYRVAFGICLAFWFVFRPRGRGVCIAVWHDTRILLVRSSYNRRLTLPGGLVRRAERYSAAAARELGEETGVHRPAEQLDFAFSRRFTHNFKRDLVHFFELRLRQEPALVVDNREIIWAAFTPVASLSPSSCAPQLRAYLAGCGHHRFKI